MTEPLELLSNFTEKAHARIQADFAEINPVVGVSRKLRSVGIPADAMTIDCLKSRKRIIVILHDDAPDVVQFQFSYIEQDPSDTFQELPLTALSENHVYNWIKEYFA